MFKKLSSILLAGALMFGASVASAQSKKEPIGIGAVKPGKALEQANAANGSITAMNRFVQAMDSQLIDRFQNTRKFTLVNRSQLDELMKEISLSMSGNLNKNDKNTARAMEVAGVKYVVVTTIDNYNDVRKELILEGGKKAGTRRIIQVSALATLYDTTSGKVLETANISLENKDVRMEQDMVKTTGDENDKLITDTAFQLADRVTNRVVDVIFPARVIARTDNIVTINRGDGTAIEVGQLYDVFALGNEMIDPDTNESLGMEEIKVGVVRITNIQPKMSKAEIIEDKGVDASNDPKKAQVLRLQKSAVPVPGR